MIHPHDVNQKVAALVRQARADADMTQTELANKAKMSRASIANIEVGSQAVNVYQLLLLAQALGVEPQSLLPTAGDFTAENPEAERLAAAYHSVLSTVR